MNSVIEKELQKVLNQERVENLSIWNLYNNS